MSYNIYINAKHIRGENMEDKQLQEQIESIIGIKIDNNNDKTEKEQIEEILNMKGE